MNCDACGRPLEQRVVRCRRPLVVVLYLLWFVLAWSPGGEFLRGVLEGGQRSALPFWKALVPLLAFIAALTAQLIRWKRPLCPIEGHTPLGKMLEVLPAPELPQEVDVPTRRKVLRVVGSLGTGAVASAGGLALAVGRNRTWVPIAGNLFASRVQNTAPHPIPQWDGSRVRNYRRLGRTNVFVSDISLGSTRINDVNVARRAIERGITYFDTAPDYSDANSEKVLGEAIKGHRDKIFLATKFCVSDGHLPNETPVPKVIEAVEASLRRLQTDHVDLIHIHACDHVDRLLAPNIHEAFDRLKQQGKVRFLGVSSHTPNLEEVANAAIDSGRFDVMMLAYHFGMWPSFGHILERARSRDIGIVAMKTLKGAKHTNLADFRDEQTSYAQAAFRWVLSNQNVSCLVISIYNQKQIDEYLYASGAPLRTDDVALLERYDQLIRGDYCQPHCGECLDSCEGNLAINDILRYRMYYKDYHWENEGRRLYARLSRNASLCMDCTAPCEGSCPTGIPIREKMVDAHQWLS